MSSSTSRRSMAVKVAAVVATVAAALPIADAHFTIVGSRDAAAWASDNRRFFPLNLRPASDCLNIPAVSPRRMAAGSTQTLSFEIGNGARHVGLCTAELIDKTTGARTPLPSQPDCVNKFDAYTFTAPTTTCTDCVVKVKVTATHLGAGSPEFYDSCLDVSITGGASGGRGQVDGPKPTPTPLPEQSRGPSAPKEGGPCNTGDMRCDSATRFSQCVGGGQWVGFAVPVGTSCKAVSQKDIQFALNP